jgi:hypothetical protein
MWWQVFGLAQLVLAFVAALGFLWLAVLVVMGWLALPELDTPRLGPLPYPLLMFAGGLLLGLALAALARTLGRAGARRRGQRVRSMLTDKVAGVARERIVGPVRLVLDRHRATRESLDRAEVRLAPASSRR